MRLTSLLCFLICFLLTATSFAAPFSETISKNSLLHYAYPVHSQYGEEGVIDEIMNRIGVKNGFLVEFGGYDGIAMSNTRVLAERGWRGAFIEPDKELFRKMQDNFRSLPNILCIQESVTPYEDDESGYTIDEIADEYFPDEEIDVMSIDIDGLDHVILKNLIRKPKLIIIEGGMYWHPMMQLEVPDEVAARNVQQPIIVMTKIAKEKGYELICSTFNAFFIRKDLYHHFADINNNPSLMWWEAWMHIKKIHHAFYYEILQIRKTPWIQEWESKDPSITFPIKIENPFAINFPEKQNLTFDDFVEVQNQIHKINIAPVLKPIYFDEFQRWGPTHFDDFLGRCSKGTWQTLIDREKGLYPIKELIQIGNGGDRCVVCCGPFNGKYPNYIKSLTQALRDQGFNGYLFYLIGGWPNPTGKEIKYAAVPYSFKIFTMVEAQKFGFNHVMWIDAACYPLREIDSLFDKIEQTGALLNWWPVPSDAWRFIFPQTRTILKQLTTTDVLNASYINSIVFGLKMNTPEAQELIRTYYEFAELGTPFLSCFPEEWVLTAIIGQDKFKHWRATYNPRLIKGSLTDKEDSPEEFDQVRREGIYFYHRKGR
jgi:hypothetical protein